MAAYSAKRQRKGFTRDTKKKLRSKFVDLWNPDELSDSIGNFPLCVSSEDVPGSYVVPNVLKTGVEANQRIGREIFMKNIRIKGYLKCLDPSVMQPGGRLAKIQILYDKGPTRKDPDVYPNYVFLNMLDAWEMTNNAGTKLVADRFWSQDPYDDRFLLIANEEYCLPSAISFFNPGKEATTDFPGGDWTIELAEDEIGKFWTAGNGEMVIPVDIYRVLNLPTIYVEDGDSIDVVTPRIISEGVIYISFLQNEGLDGEWVFNGNIRLEFEDI